MNLPEFSILITTKNRLADLKITLSQIYNIIEFDDFDFIICDDGSTDGTYEFIKSNYPKIRVIKSSSRLKSFMVGRFIRFGSANFKNKY